MKKMLYIFFAFVIGTILTAWFLDERAAQIISVASIIIIAVLLLCCHIEKAGARQIILMAAPMFSNVLKVFGEMDFAKGLSGFYNGILKYVFAKLGIEYTYNLGGHTCLMITFWIIFCICYIGMMLYRNHKSKKGLNGSALELSDSNYIDKSIKFCKALRQRVESINRKTDWNESLFTPIEAEVEACVNGKRKKKYRDLLSCLKKNRRDGTVFLVLGEPGSGKSVALRKLCLDLLDDFDKTKRMPVYIDLKKWNTEWNIDNLPTKKDLTEFIKSVLYENGDILTDGFLNFYFDKMLENGRWYFVFDSFDELPCLMGKQGCYELIDHMSSLLYDFITGANQGGGVIASRLYKCPSESLKATVTLRIQEFSDIKIKTMLQKYLNGSAEVVKKLFGNREDLVVLCRNPFYLTLLINYIMENGVVFPKNQMELYRSFVNGRLNRCIDKIEYEGLSVEEVHKAARQLADFMQQSTAYGLECPAKVLYQSGDEQYWKKVLELLKYAKICRFGGADETVSFVHRRFHEFFVVENIFEQQKDIDYSEYSSIVNNSGMRDALVLYCEIADDDKAKEIAGFCWDVVKSNIKWGSNILDDGCIELVNSLHFMSEAFRNRKSALEDFLEEFQELVESNLDEDIDFVVLHALTSSMVLFKQERLQKLVLKVFKLENRWLTDMVVKNCRIIKNLDSRVETKFCEYFMQLDFRTFFERFRNTQFSLSLSKNFRYVKKVHLTLFLVDISMVFTMVCLLILAVPVLLSRMDLINMQTVYWLETSRQDMSVWQSLVKAYNEFDLVIQNDFIIVIFYIALLMNLGTNYNIVDYGPTSIVRSVLYFAAAYFGALVMEYGIFTGHIWIGIISLIFITNSVLQLSHNIYYAIKENRFRRVLNRISLKFFLSLVAICVVAVAFVVLLIMLIEKYPIIGIIMACLIGAGIFCGAASWVIVFLKDWRWFRKQPITKKISREQVEDNLDSLYTKKWRREYVEFLMQHSIVLTGEWRDGSRPQYDEDEVVLKLAKLDCAGLGNLHSRL